MFKLLDIHHSSESDLSFERGIVNFLEVIWFLLDVPESQEFFNNFFFSSEEPYLCFTPNIEIEIDIDISKPRSKSKRKLDKKKRSRSKSRDKKNKSKKEDHSIVTTK